MSGKAAILNFILEAMLHREMTAEISASGINE
jgi:hypothetical protein